MKRFWDTATAAPHEEGGFTLLLDGRPMRLPAGGQLRLATERLADALAAEWQEAGGAKGGEMTMEMVPLTRVVSTAIDRVAPDPGPSVDAIAQYGETDLLCYRGEDPRLAAIQAAEWQPLLDWAALELDAPLKHTNDIRHVAQPPESLAALRRAVAALPPLPLTALGLAVPLLGSVVLGLAMVHRRLDAAEATRLAMVEESWQQDFWGEDAEAMARRRAIARDVALAERVMLLARD
ncbi:chaperone, ATP12 [Roseomonas marmotae]|uniref:Chaperone, ATP12 n=2 Tax=Roseomonas marmotae TaxID=2768161 RepID=A0ABS3K7G1_9PROT|nr:ATP12 family protein [Roseomonas marmotae]MBO1073399.1 chaperone, ATP12 [Roseomonas marmotae]QTI80403.1 chaperone, ATP12 [Roseomonas marmotae]